MSTATPACAPVVLQRDPRAIRETLQRIKESERLAPLNLFGRRSPERMLDYLDRRATDRESVELPVYWMPVDLDDASSELLMADPLQEKLAFTRDVSLRGLGLSHDEPLETNFAIVTFELFDGESVSLLLDVRWANLQRRFSYMSGGRFVGIIDPIAP